MRPRPILYHEFVDEGEQGRLFRYVTLYPEEPNSHQHASDNVTGGISLQLT